MNTTTIRNMTAGEFEQHINALVVVDANGLTTTIRDSPLARRTTSV